MTNKKTKRDYFAELRAMVGDNKDLLAFIDHELELLNKKNSGRKKENPLNDLLVEVLVAEMSANPNRLYTATELANIANENSAIAEKSEKQISSQKVTSILKKLGKDGTNEISRLVEKGTAYYQIANTDEIAEDKGQE